MNIDFDLTIAARLTGAVLLALPTAWNREMNSRIMGLRTFPLVSLGACSYVLVAIAIVGSNSSPDLLRVLSGLMAGIGFVGGGAILKSDDRVRGTTSAASIWVTGALGAAVGFGQWGIAIMLSVLNVALIIGFSKLKETVVPKEQRDV